MQSAIVQCEQIMRQRGPTYYWATRLFPQEIREAVYVLYAFYRIPDDIVDENTSNSPKDINKELTNWEQEWQQAIKGKTIKHPVLQATYNLHRNYQIPFAYSFAFLKAMRQDLTKDRYVDYQELCDYMYGSAGVVGIMLTYIVGTKYPEQFSKALDYASKLGYAMQLTNFIRDIQEDILDRQRIYLPLDELSKYNIIEEEFLEQKVPTPQLNSFLKAQIKRCRNLYKTADIGIRLLNPVGQFPVLLASRLYEYQLDLIEKQNLNILQSSDHFKPNKLQKLWLTIRTLFSYQFQWKNKKS